MKLSNGNTLMAAETFTATLTSIKGRIDTYQSAAEYAMVHWFDHGDKMKLERLMKAFVGASGRIIGDGRLLAAYINALSYGFKIEADGSVKVEVKKNGKPKPRGFKGFNDSGDLSWKAGGYHLGFSLSFKAWMKAEEEKKAEKKAEREAKAAEAEAAAEAAKAAKAEAAKAEAEADTEAEAEADTIDYSRMANVAWALNELASSVLASQSRDIEAMAEAAKAADTIAGILRKRIAEAEAEAEADAAAEAEADAAAEAEAMQQ